MKFGWFRVSRKLFAGDDPFWETRGPWSHREAWLDLIQMAAWSEEDGRGTIRFSERAFATRWNWSRGRVRRFIQALVERESLVLLRPGTTGGTPAVYALVNYDLYQSPQKPKKPSQVIVPEVVTEPTGPGFPHRAESFPHSKPSDTPKKPSQVVVAQELTEPTGPGFPHPETGGGSAAHLKTNADNDLRWSAGPHKKEVLPTKVVHTDKVSSLRSETPTLERGEVLDEKKFHQLAMKHWYDQQPFKPTQREMSKQGGVLKKLVEDHGARDVMIALAGVRHTFPHSKGEPWDFVTLRRRFSQFKANAAKLYENVALKDLLVDMGSNWESARGRLVV